MLSITFPIIMFPFRFDIEYISTKFFIFELRVLVTEETRAIQYISTQSEYLRWSERVYFNPVTSKKYYEVFCDTCIGVCI